MRKKLISVSKSTQNGCSGEFKGRRVVIKNSKGEIICIGINRNSLYYVQVDKEAQEKALTVEEDSLKLWHERFGHINKNSVVKTSKAVLGMNKLDDFLSKNKDERSKIDCISCRIGKQSRLHFPSSSQERATSVGKAIHMDICGPFGEGSAEVKQYFILFKDEYSNYRFIYFLKSRDEAFDCIRETVATIYAETQKEVRQIVSDCGSEFTSKRSKEYFVQNKILHRKSAPFTPAQNGFIERDNRTVMEGARSLMVHMKVPSKLWTEATTNMVYLLNRSVNVNTNGKTPYELYYGKVPSVSHLRIFGSLAVVKTVEKKRSGYQKKLDARGIVGILVGYSKNFTYRISVPSENKILVVRDVVFDEGKTLETIEQNYKNVDDYINSISYENYDSDETVSCNGLDELEANDSSQEEDANVANVEPSTYYEAINCENSKEWIMAKDDEYDSLIKNKTWVLSKLPEGRQAVTCKWVFKLKTGNGQVRYKVRLVARGFTQREGIDYQETFSYLKDGFNQNSVSLVCSVQLRSDSH